MAAKRKKWSHKKYDDGQDESQQDAWQLTSHPTHFGHPSTNFFFAKTANILELWRRLR